MKGKDGKRKPPPKTEQGRGSRLPENGPGVFRKSPQVTNTFPPREPEKKKSGEPDKE